MTTLTTEETGTAQATSAEEPKAGKKARVGAKRAHVAPKKAKAARTEESAQGRKECRVCPWRQQGGEDSRPAEAAWRRND